MVGDLTYHSRHAGRICLPTSCRSPDRQSSREARPKQTHACIQIKKIRYVMLCYVMLCYVMPCMYV